MKRMTFMMAWLFALAVLVYAGNAHFVGLPSITQSDSTVFISGKVAGLGNVPQIDVQVSGFAECVNRGKNKPSADNKDAFSANGSFPVQNGKANFQLSMDASFTPDCAPPMVVEWSDIRIVVTAADGTFLQFP
jgi:hypothetical protein